MTITNDKVNTKKMKICLFGLLILLSGCDWISFGVRSESPEATLVRKAIKHYNDHDEKAYGTCFSENVSYFSSNGLGTTRHATGIAEIESFHAGLFKMYKPSVEIVNMFDIPPWVFVHQRTKSSKSTTEASVGYRIEKGKIADVMVVGEKKLLPNSRSAHPSPKASP